MCRNADIQPHTISIHPPREGWDLKYPPSSVWLGLFQSTHPVRGGTGAPLILDRKEAKFQSTHPVRGGTCIPILGNIVLLFQSTHPVRGGTVLDGPLVPFRYISIHPPREGWDQASSHRSAS